jgi:hypothetical protein
MSIWYCGVTGDRKAVEISWVELVDHLEQQLVWEMEERHQLSLLLE